MVGAAVKVDRSAKKTVKLLVEAGVDVIVMESDEDFIGQLEHVKWIKNQYSEVDVIAGNVATVRQAKLLIEAGADAIQITKESGPICMT